MYELIQPDSAIDPPVTSPSVCVASEQVSHVLW